MQPVSQAHENNTSLEPREEIFPSLDDSRLDTRDDDLHAVNMLFADRRKVYTAVSKCIQ